MPVSSSDRDKIAHLGVSASSESDVLRLRGTAAVTLAALSRASDNSDMLWEDRALRQITEADIRRLVESGLEEHLQLEYKSELYGDNDRGRREFLLDVCMFANASGGILLIGIPERRDAEGRPTGAPDPGAMLGVEVGNHEAVLAGYDARVMEAIEERLPLESSAIEIAGGRRVLAIQVPNSTRKPHSVRREGRIYFPSRRQRQRYFMTVREIKESVMRTVSRIDEAKILLFESFGKVVRADDAPYLIVGMIPAFFEDFTVDIKSAAVRTVLTTAVRSGELYYVNPVYTFDGLERREDRFDYKFLIQRNGLLRASFQLPHRIEQNRHIFSPEAVDILLRRFVFNAARAYESAMIGPPYILCMMLRAQVPLVGAYQRGNFPLGEERTETIAAGDYRFPYGTVDNLSGTDGIIRPFCDQAWQLFGENESRCFNLDGVWIGRNA